MRSNKRRARAFPASVGWSWAPGCAGSRLSADAFGTAPTIRDFTRVSHQAVVLATESIDRGGGPVVSEKLLHLGRRPRRTAGRTRPARAPAANDREGHDCCVDGRGSGADRPPALESSNCPVPARFSNAESRSSTAGSSSTPPAFHERPALVEALLLQDEYLRRRLSRVDQEALAARQAWRDHRIRGALLRRQGRRIHRRPPRMPDHRELARGRPDHLLHGWENRFVRTTMSSAEAGGWVMSADGDVDGEVERDVVRHALPSGRRPDRAPRPCERVAEMTTRALELSFYGRKLNREAVGDCPERK